MAQKQGDAARPLDEVLGSAGEPARLQGVGLRVENGVGSFEVGSDQALTFGSAGVVRIGSAPTVPSVVGRIHYRRDGCWWVVNSTSTIGLVIDDEVTTSRLSLAPGATCPVPFSEAQVRFRVGSTSYEFAARTPNAGGASDRWIEAAPVRPSDVRNSLNADQVLLLVGLAEPRLRQFAGPEAVPPTNREVAHRLGWTVTKYNRKLDHLCQKLDRIGVYGLKGCIGQAAGYRKITLVDYVITAGVIVAEDLVLLDRGPGKLAASA
jgi:hypothetical protein